MNIKSKLLRDNFKVFSLRPSLWFNSPKYLIREPVSCESMIVSFVVSGIIFPSIREAACLILKDYTNSILFN